MRLNLARFASPTSLPAGIVMAQARHEVPRAVLEAQRIMRETGEHGIRAGIQAAQGGGGGAGGGDTAAILGRIEAAIQKKEGEQQEQINALEAAFNEHALKLAAVQLGGNGAEPATDPAYTRPFAAWFRSGQGEDAVRDLNATGDRARINAAMTEGSNSDGGYLAPTEWDRKINQSLVNISPLRRLCDVRTTTVSAYSTLWKLTGPGTGWVHRRRAPNDGPGSGGARCGRW